MKYQLQVKDITGAIYLGDEHEMSEDQVQVAKSTIQTVMGAPSSYFTMQCNDGWLTFTRSGLVYISLVESS